LRRLYNESRRTKIQQFLTISQTRRFLWCLWSPVDRHTRGARAAAVNKGEELWANEDVGP